MPSWDRVTDHFPFLTRKNEQAWPTSVLAPRAALLRVSRIALVAGPSLTVRRPASGLIGKLTSRLVSSESFCLRFLKPQRRPMPSRCCAPCPTLASDKTARTGPRWYTKPLTSLSCAWRSSRRCLPLSYWRRNASAGLGI